MRAAVGRSVRRLLLRHLGAPGIVSQRLPASLPPPPSYRRRTLLALVVCSQNFPRAAAAVKIAAAVSLFLLLWFGMAKGPLPPGEGRLRAGCLSDEAMCCQIYGLDVQTNLCAFALGFNLGVEIGN